MKNTIKLFGIAALVAVIGFSMAACDDGTTEEKKEEEKVSFDTTALSTVINEAVVARTGVEKASAATEVPTGKKWVTESEWNAFDGVYKTAVETKANPSSQSAVDTAKQNLQAAIVTFNAAKKDGTAAAITLSGTITVKNNEQIVPYVIIQAYTDDWSWGEEVRVRLTGENTPWSIITSPFSSSKEIDFEVSGYDNDQYENALFSTTVDGLRKTVHNTNVTGININLNYNLITISGTLNLNYGKLIPSVRIEIGRKNGGRLGIVNIVNVGNSAPWSMTIPSQSVDTDITFNVIGFDGPIPYEYDQLFALWGQDFGVKVRNQNKTGIALNLITISGTVNVAYNGGRVPTVNIHIMKRLGGDWQWTAMTELHSPPANAPWSIVIPAFTNDTEIKICTGGEDVDGNELFWIEAERTVKNTNVSGIAINPITLSGTINVTYNGNTAPIVMIYIHAKVGEDWGWIGGHTFNNPSANAPWFVFIPAFTSDTEVHINVGVGNDEDKLIWDPENSGPTATRTVKNTNVSGITLNLGNVTD